MTGSLTITFADAMLELLPERALWWPEERALLVADVHIGKGTSFRKRGMAVPTGSSAGTLQRLQHLAATRAARQLIVLGDFIHALFDTRIEALVASWLEQLTGTEVVLVLGNHDRALRDRLRRAPGALAALRCVEAYELGGLTLCHDDRHAIGPVLVGHLHPCVRVAANRSDGLRLPVFWQSAKRLVLPAFGEFTGGQLVTPEPEDQVFAVTGETVVDVSKLVTPRGRQRGGR